MKLNGKAVATGSEDSIRARQNQILTFVMIIGVILVIILMYYRAFFGIDLTDESLYIAEAKCIVDGNVPYSYMHRFSAVGFTFLIIPLVAVYGFFVPDLAGVFLFTKLCFVTYKVIVWAVVYSVFARRLIKPYALLISAMIIPLSGHMLNFSYNTVPELTFFMVGCLLYDVIEQNAPHKTAKLIISGFMSGIACFANPGWGLALIIFVILIAVRIKETKEKIKAMLLFCGAVLFQVLTVVIPICLQTSVSEFLYGIYRLFFKPVGSGKSNRSYYDIVYFFKYFTKQWLFALIMISVLSYIAIMVIKYKPRNPYSKKQLVAVTVSMAVAYTVHSTYVVAGVAVIASLVLATVWDRTATRIENKRNENKQMIIAAVTVSFFCQLMYLILTRTEHLSFTNGGDLRGFLTVLFLIAFFAVRLFDGEKIIWYLGIYQTTYVLTVLILVEGYPNSPPMARFLNAYTILIPIMYVLIKNRSKLVKSLSIILAASTVISLVYADYRLMYYDDDLPDLKYKVSDGVFKGMYTSDIKLEALPELEEYLNSVIEEDESYSFRDNVPFAYLMVHKGRMCDNWTWDTLQYSYGGNAPSELFDYYRVCDMVPDKIIYIDYGKDKYLSIDKPDFKYNDWVNEYYDLVEDKKVNDFFFRVMVFKYNGKFDGNYQQWIDRYLD